MIESYAVEYYEMMQKPWLGLGNTNRVLFKSKNPELFVLQINKLRPEEFSNLPEIPEDNKDYTFEAYHRELTRLKILVEEVEYELPPVTDWWWPHVGSWEEGDNTRKHKKFLKHVKHCLDLHKALY